MCFCKAHCFENLPGGVQEGTFQLVLTEIDSGGRAWKGILVRANFAKRNTNLELNTHVRDAKMEITI